MDLTSYAELAARLVNTGAAGGGHQDELVTVEAYRALMADRAALCTRVTAADLDALRELRSQLRLIFAACAAGDGDAAAARLNGLLARHPIHPEIARHDGGRGAGADHRGHQPRHRPAAPLRGPVLPARARGYDSRPLAGLLQ